MVDEQLLRDLQHYVLGQPNLQLTSEGVVEIDPERVLNEQVRVSTQLAPNFTHPYLDETVENNE